MSSIINTFEKDQKQDFYIEMLNDNCRYFSGRSSPWAQWLQNDPNRLNTSGSLGFPGRDILMGLNDMAVFSRNFNHCSVHDLPDCI